MGRITLSIEAAMKAIDYSNEARENLLANIGIMDNEINSQFSGLQDPSFKRYLELSDQMQNLIKQVGAKMDALSEYCQKVIAWIKSYSEY